MKVESDQASVDAEFAINRREFDLNYAGKPNDLIRDDVVINPRDLLCGGLALAAGSAANSDRHNARARRPNDDENAAVSAPSVSTFAIARRRRLTLDSVN